MKQLQFRKLHNLKTSIDQEIQMVLITWKFAGREDQCMALAIPTEEGLSVKYYHNQRLKYYPPFEADIEFALYLIIGGDQKVHLAKGLKRALEPIITECTTIRPEADTVVDPQKLVGLTIKEYMNLILSHRDDFKAAMMYNKIPKH